MTEKDKPKIGIISLTSCEGCEVSILSLGQKLLNLEKKVDISQFRYLEEEPWPDHFDIVFVEGTPITKEEIKTLKKARKKADKLGVLGNCAALGGVQEIKNYEDKEKIARQIYSEKTKIQNPDLKEVDNFVKVDFKVPGCPVNPEEFLEIINQLIQGRQVKIPQKPVCIECPLGPPKGEGCFLSQEKICFGLWSVAGCNAPCQKGGLPCYGCRGFLDKFQPKALLKVLGKFAKKEEILEHLEIFGLRDNFRERLEGN